MALKTSITTTADPERQNELNFLAWKNEHAQRRRQLQTQFNIWRAHQSTRMNQHHNYKTESEEQSEQLKMILHQRLQKACSCETCRLQSARAAGAETKSTLLRPTVNRMPSASS